MFWSWCSVDPHQCYLSLPFRSSHCILHCILGHHCSAYYQLFLLLSDLSGLTLNIHNAGFNTHLNYTTHDFQSKLCQPRNSASNHMISHQIYRHPIPIHNHLLITHIRFQSVQPLIYTGVFRVALRFLAPAFMSVTLLRHCLHSCLSLALNLALLNTLPFRFGSVFACFMTSVCES